MVKLKADGSIDKVIEKFFADEELKSRIIPIKAIGFLDKLFGITFDCQSFRYTFCYTDSKIEKKVIRQTTHSILRESKLLNHQH